MAKEMKQKQRKVTPEELSSFCEQIALMLDSGMTPEDIINALLGGLDVNILEEQPVEYRCTCSRERTTKALITLGRDELLKLLEEQAAESGTEELEVVCRFCDRKQYYRRSDIEAMF